MHRSSRVISDECVLFAFLSNENPSTADGARFTPSWASVFLIHEEFYMYEGTTRVTTGRAYTA